MTSATAGAISTGPGAAATAATDGLCGPMERMRGRGRGPGSGSSMTKPTGVPSTAIARHHSRGSTKACASVAPEAKANPRALASAGNRGNGTVTGRGDVGIRRSQ